MIAHRTGSRARFTPQLPTLNDDRVPGSKFTRRAMRRIFALFVALVLVAIVVTASVSVDITVDGSGILEPVEVRGVHAAEAGVIAAVYVATGDTVREGQVLAQIDPLALESQLDQLELQYRAALLELQRAEAAAPIEERRQRAELAGAQATVIRQRATLRQRLREYGIETDLDSVLAGYTAGQHVALDLAVAELLSAQASYRAQVVVSELLGLGRFDRDRRRTELKRLRTEIDLVQERLDRLRIRSPTRGTILTEQLDGLVGSHLSAGQLVLEVADGKGWRAVLLVEGRDIHHIRVGDPVKVEVDALGEALRRTLEGQVTFIAPQPVDGANATQRSSPLFRVEATIDPGQISAIGVGKFRRGYSVRGTIVTRSGRILSILWLKLTETLPLGL